MGEPGFPTPPPAGGPRPPAGAWGNRGSPCPRPQGGLALPQGHGETGVPHAPAHRGASPSRREMGKPGFPSPRPREGKGAALAQGAWGNRGSPALHPVGGFGRAKPSQEEPYVHCGVMRRSRMEGCGDHRSPRAAPLPASPRWGEEPGSRPQRGRGREGAVTVPAEPRCGRDARAPRACASRRGAPCA